MTLHTFLVALLTLSSTSVRATSTVDVAKKPSINNTLEFGVETECKTCPYSLCTNKEFYTYDTQVELTCWTSGTSIGNDTTWLKTTDDCYVTQYDLSDYNGTYERDLNFCGEASTELHLTYDSATVKYDTECNLCPDNYLCDTIQYLSPDTDLTLTCWTDEGEAVLGNTVWAKTTSNCYLSETGLGDEVNKDAIDNCGPVGFLQLNYTDDATATIETAKVVETKHKAGKAPLRGEPEIEAKRNVELSKRYLLNITVGEDYAYCHDCASSDCEVEKRYPFNHPVYVQCYEDTGSTNSNETYWYLTTDFCYVREIDFWESLFDQYRFPSCSNFDNDDEENKKKTKAQVSV